VKTAAGKIRKKRQFTIPVNGRRREEVNSSKCLPKADAPPAQKVKKGQAGSLFVGH
jgi:hypothetical protein